MWWIIGGVVLFLFVFWDRDTLPTEENDDD
jgi:hypothetical protein